MPRNLPTRDQFGHFCTMSDTDAPPSLDQLAAVLSQLLGAPVGPDILANKRAMAMLRGTLCPPGASNAQPDKQDADADADGKLSEDRRQQLLNASQLGQAALKAASNSASDTDPQASPGKPAWLLGAPGADPEGNGPALSLDGRPLVGQAQKFSERPISRADAQRAAQRLISTTPTRDGATVQPARLDHLRKLASVGHTASKRDK